MGKATLEVPEGFGAWVLEEAEKRGVPPEKVLEELRTQAEARPEPKVEVLDAWWDPSMSIQHPEHRPSPEDCYVVLQVGLRVFNAGRRRYLAQDFSAEITMADDVRQLEQAGGLPHFVEPPPETAPGVQPPSYGCNVAPRYGELLPRGAIVSVEPDGFAETTINFWSRGAGPLEASGRRAPFRLWWSDHHAVRFQLEGAANAVVIGIRPVR